MNSTTKKYLVISSVGDNSLHPQWIKGNERNFDLLLDYYGNIPNQFINDSDIYFQRKGMKFPKLHQIITENHELINKYEAVWVPDDDLTINTEEINRMFHIFSENNLLLAQPALTHDSYSGFWKEITMGNTNFHIRYTNFVEVMAPIFSKDALFSCLETFRLSQSGYGLDLVWPNLLGYPINRIAIIDSVTIGHLRPTGTGDLYRNLKVNRMEELHKICKEYNVSLPYKAVTYGGIKINDANPIRKGGV